MKLLSVVMTTGAVAIISATASFAADIVAPNDDFKWSGFYVGVQGGFASIMDSFKDPAYGGAPPATYGNFDLSGLTGGLHAGYDWQRNSTVFGIVSDFGLASGSGGADDATSFVHGTATEKWQGSTRLKLGYAIKKTELYVTGGVAYANFDLGYQFPIPGGTVDRFNTTRLGYTLGAGMDFALNDRLTLGAEYRFTDYGTASGSIAACCAPSPNAQDHSLSSHMVQFDLSYHF